MGLVCSYPRYSGCDLSLDTSFCQLKQAIFPISCKPDLQTVLSYIENFHQQTVLKLPVLTLVFVGEIPRIQQTADEVDVRKWEWVYQDQSIWSSLVSQNFIGTVQLKIPDWESRGLAYLAALMQRKLPKGKVSVSHWSLSSFCANATQEAGNVFSEGSD